MECGRLEEQCGENAVIMSICCLMDYWVELNSPLRSTKNSQQQQHRGTSQDQQHGGHKYPHFMTTWPLVTADWTMWCWAKQQIPWGLSCVIMIIYQLVLQNIWFGSGTRSADWKVRWTTVILLKRSSPTTCYRLVWTNESVPQPSPHPALGL